MFDWNDLRFLLAVARDGSTIAAARSLSVNQSTVQRRLAELERRLGQPVAERQTDGYRLTPFGETLMSHATEVERAALALQQQVELARHDLSGVVRVTCPEPMIGRLTHSAPLERFHARYPGLRVEFVMSDRYIDLRDRADAHLAHPYAAAVAARAARGRVLRPHGRRDRLAAAHHHRMTRGRCDA
jgi:DNA-binding transcriptional LysR family regulator